MKRLTMILVLILCLVPLAALTEAAAGVTRADLVAAAEADFPDWDLMDCDQYESGRYGDQRASWVAISLMRVADSTLYQRTLTVLVNPLEPEQPVPWIITDWAPIPLSPEAEDALLSMDPADLYTDEDGYAGEPGQLSPLITPGCAAFLLNEGESWDALFAYPSALAGVVERADGQRCIRVAHWDGGQYDSVTSSRFFSDDWFSINGFHSGDGIIAVRCESCDPMFVCQPDGRWVFTGLADSGWTLYLIGDGFVTDANFLALYDSNDVLHYGFPTFERDLTTADIPAIPSFIRDVIPLLDSSAFACVAADETPMLDSPGGQPTAFCYARLTGRIIGRADGYVQLQIGRSETGLTGWFAEEDLALGPDIEGVRCGFPTHSRADCDGTYLAGVLTGVDAAALPDTTCLVWLIGQLPNGDWLVQLDMDTVCTAPADAFHGIGPARALWAEFEANYDDMMEEWMAWEEDEWEE